MIIRRNLQNAILSLSVVLSTGIAGPAVDANAYEGIGQFSCLGTGLATLGSGLSYFPNTMANVGFTFTFNCLTGGSFTGSGTLDSGACGRSSGGGTFAGSTSFFLIETGGTMIFASGEDSVLSFGNANPIPDTSTIPFGNSCSNGTAKNFQLVGGMTCVDTNDGAICNSLRH